jgi:phospholipid transport system transporter-binding protein
MTLQAAIKEQEGCLIVSGDLNFFTVVELWNSSLPLLLNKTSLTFDFSDVTSTNSAGLALLLEWLRYAKRHAQSISFDHMPSQLASIASVAGVTKMLGSPSL